MSKHEILPPHHGKEIDVELELDRYAQRYSDAGGLGITLLNMLGSQAESLMDQLPDQVQNGLEGATESALRQAMKAAHGSRKIIKPNDKMWLQPAMATALGAAGGSGGAATALAELPVTTALLLRVIQDTAEREGFDPESEAVKFDCVRVFASAGPLSHDDGSDLAFLSTRFVLAGSTMQGLIAKVAPSLAIVFGKKLAAQAVPVIGAVAGAATNYAYTSYYREMAAITFGLRRLAIEADADHDVLLEGVGERLKALKAT